MASQGFQQLQKQTQSLVLAPQLRQSLKILQVPALELRTAILEELQSNPVLEELPMEDVSIEQQREDPDAPGNDHDGADGDDHYDGAELDQGADRDRADHDDDSLDFSRDFEILRKMDEDWTEMMYQEAGETHYTSEEAKRRQHFFESLTGGTSLQESLMEQARMSESDPETLSALEYLIGSLDDRGFLSVKASDVALMARLPLKTVQQAITLLRTLEPAGIGAENLQDCLLMQLAAQGQARSLAATIIREHWDLLLRRRLPDIARNCGVHVEAVQDAVDTIAKLDPAPGRQFSDDSNHVIEPDVTVERDDYGGWQVILNSDYIPRLRLSRSYKEMLAKGVLRGKDREFIQEKLRSGKFLINSIEQRQQTIERITRELIDLQAGFFEHGTSQLKPLIMNTVAERIGVHETTISRAIANKYMRTPHGVFEFKYFFTPGYENEDGNAVSNKSVKERIAKIVESEPANKPFSDQKIAEILEEEGVKIARRTVAKYREELGILPTNLRRQYA